MNFGEIREKIDELVDTSCFSVEMQDDALIYKGAADIYDNKDDVKISLIKSVDNEYIVKVVIGDGSLKYFCNNVQSAIDTLENQLKLANGNLKNMFL